MAIEPSGYEVSPIHIPLDVLFTFLAKDEVLPTPTYAEFLDGTMPEWTLDPDKE